jgi:uncharacterized protein (DUF1697 family)
MPRFVVLLRGVNVGKGNRLPMAEFRRLLEAKGCTEVRTLLNSGNAVFSGAARSAKAHAKTVQAALQESFGLNIQVVVKSSAEFQAAVEENSFAPPEAEHSRFLVAFAQERGAMQELSALLPLVQSTERFRVGNQAAYLHCAGGILQSKAATALLGKTGRSVTTRNWATVLKLREFLLEQL